MEAYLLDSEELNFAGLVDSPGDENSSTNRRDILQSSSAMNFLSNNTRFRMQSSPLISERPRTREPLPRKNFPSPGRLCRSRTRHARRFSSRLNRGDGYVKLGKGLCANDNSERNASSATTVVACYVYTAAAAAVGGDGGDGGGAQQ